ncbi:uncharacterized protein LOC143210800 [Lasioglossum baleicum]|uniref:uncharacterized protein LOC143210800 n=1 Tax=Lasioglossum baleicum TaxID=434251 RepID=UPI003FCD6E5A
MADDPNRDILPVKEGSYADTSRGSIDPRERHSVYKLDRYVLEDKYLRLLDEVNSLKKLSNSQEDKIKRLATKLMRVIANPRPSSCNSNGFDDKSRLLSLELENTKLKDKITVLRNQLLSHTIHSRTSSRTRNPQTRPSSARTSSQSDTSRTKIPSCHCIVRAVNDDDVNGSRTKIEELENQKKEMADRIAEMEKERSSREIDNQREKVAENVEYIRRWRQMKQMNDKLIAVENTNESLNGQTNDLRRMLEEEKKHTEEAASALEKEQKRSSELDEEILKLKNCELTLREKEEQIKDLMNEIKILQQHNNELMELSSKNGEVEHENAELKKKVSEQRQHQESLRSAYNTEQANIMALQASNEQLLAKLQELQTTIDSLTAQLTSFQSQAEKQETTKVMQIPAEQADRMIPAMTNTEPQEISASEILLCKNCCGLSTDVTQCGEKIYAAATLAVFQPVHKQVQTEGRSELVSLDKIDQGTSVTTPSRVKIGEEEQRSDIKISDRVAVPESPLTPEKMLKLLEQAQITVPMDSSRFGHKDIASNVNYNDALDRNQRHRQVVSLEKLLFGDTVSGAFVPEITEKLCCSDAETHVQGIPPFQPQSDHQKYDNHAYPTKCPLPDTDKMLSVLFNVFKELSLSAKVLDKATNLYRPTIKGDRLDGNNNIDVTGIRILKRDSTRGQQAMICPFGTDSMNIKSKGFKGSRAGCSWKKYCSGISGRLRQDKSKRKGSFPSTKSSTDVAKRVENGDCTCNSTLGCTVYSDCGHSCCNGGGPVNTPEEYTTENNNQYDQPPIVMKNGTESFPSVINNILNSTVQCNAQKGAEGTITIRKLQDEVRKVSYRSKDTSMRYSGLEKEELDDAATLQEYITELDRCKQLVDKTPFNNGPCGIPVKAITKALDLQRCCEISTAESQCSTNCPRDCVDSASTLSDTFPMVIPDGQGLMELHISSLQLLTSAKQILFRDTDMHNVSVFVCWDIWDQDTICTPTLKCSDLNFNFSIVYRIPDLFCFFNYVFSELVVFQVNVNCDDGDSCLVASGKLSIKDILDYPQNKLHYVAPMYSVFPCSLGSNFGQLSLWVRLSCDVEQVDAFKRKHNILVQPDPGTGEPTWNAQDRLPETPHGSLMETETAPMGMDKSSPSYKLSQEGFTYDQTRKALIPETSSTSTTKTTIVTPLLYSIHVKRKSARIRGLYHPDIPNMIMEPDTEDKLTVMKDTESDYQLTPSPLLAKRKEVSDIHAELTTDPDDVLKDTFPFSDYADGEADMSQSRREFNAVLKHGSRKETIVSKDDSDDSMQEVTNVILEKNWQQYRKRSYNTYNKLSNFNIVIRVLRHSKVEGCLSLDCECACKFMKRLIVHKLHGSKMGNTSAKKLTETRLRGTKYEFQCFGTFLERDTIIIEIVNIILFPKSSVMMNAAIQLIYVEYCFLGHCGADMETVSARKPVPPEEKMEYNFRKEFQVDSERHLMQDSILRAMLNETTNPEIKFIIVCEPVPEETETKDCIEIGYAYFNLRKYALGTGEKFSSIPIYSSDEAEQIGLLKVETTFRLSSTIYFILINYRRF